MKTKRTRKILVALLIVASVLVVSQLLIMAASAFVESRSIGLGNAVDLSLYNANVSEADAEITRAKLTLKSGEFIYSIKFRAGNTLYEYEIAADDGEVLHVSTLPLDQAGTGSSGSAVTLEQAKQAALADAGLAEADVVFTETKADRDDGVAVYDISFYTQTGSGLCSYDYEILASNGAVAVAEASCRLNRIPDAAIGAGASLSQDDAQAAALADAGLTAGQVALLRTELEREDGAPVYEIEFRVTTETAVTEYDYEVLATDGTLLTRKTETRYLNAGLDGGDGSTGNTGSSGNAGGSGSTGGITMEDAKSIALQDAGLNAGQVYFKKVQLDRDDGRTVYEVEFLCNGYEYEYEIDSKTGSILERDREWDD